jgi:Tfp pilus assembly protein PilF
VRAGNPHHLQAMLAEARGMIAEARDQLPDAVTDYAHGVELDRAQGTPSALSNALQLQCGAEVRTGQFALAQQHCTEAVTIVAQALGPDHPFVAEAETNLGFVAVTQNDFKGARAIWERALARLDRGHDDDVLGLATVLVNLGTISLYDDEPAARRYLTRLQSATATAGTNPKNLAVQVRMAELLRKTDPAAGLLALETIARRAEATLGLANRTTAYALEDLAGAYHQSGRIRDAKLAFERNLEAVRLLYGERSLTTLATENRYGQTLVELGEAANARPVLERIVLAVEQMSPDSPFLAEAYTNLADCLLQLGDAAHAEDYAKRGLAIREHGDDPLQTSEVRFILGKAMWKARKDPKAIEVVTKSRDEMRAIGPRASTLPEVEAWLKQARGR